MASQSSAFSVGNLAQIFTRVYILMIFGHHSRHIDHFLTVQYPPYLFKIKVISMKIIVTVTVFIMERKIQTLKDPGTIADTAAHYEKKFQDHSRLASFIVTSCL